MTNPRMKKDQIIYGILEKLDGDVVFQEFRVTAVHRHRTPTGLTFSYSVVNTVDREDLPASSIYMEGELEWDAALSLYTKRLSSMIPAYFHYTPRKLTRYYNRHLKTQIKIHKRQIQDLIKKVKTTQTFPRTYEKPN